jgi:hypothetical protein
MVLTNALTLIWVVYALTRIKQNNQPGTMFEYVDMLSDQACMAFIFYKQ